MKIREIRSDEIDRFNNFTAWFEWGDLLQSYEWGELKAKSQWTPIRIIAEDINNNIIATASILKKKLPVINKSIFYIPRGFTLDTKNKELTIEFTNEIKKIAQKHNAILIKIDPPVNIEDKTSLNNILQAGFLPVNSAGFGGTQPKCVMQLDCSRALDEIFASFKEKWRYNIRLAQRRGVTCKTECTKEDLPIFYELLKETCKRDGFLVRSYDYFSDMWNLLYPKGNLKVFLTYFEETPVSGSLCYLWGNKAMYTYGASSNLHRKHMPNHLMQWEMITWAHNSKCKIYDFRGVSPKKDGEFQDDKLSGLNKFKEGFSPDFIEYIGEFDLVIDKVFYFAWVTLLPKIKNILKKRAKSNEN